MTKKGQLTGRKAMLVIDFLMLTGFAMMAYGMLTMRPGIAPNWGFVFGGLLFFWMAVMELPDQHGNGSANAGWSGGPSRREYPGLPSLPDSP